MIFVFYGSTAAHIKEIVHPERKILSSFTILSQRKFFIFCKISKRNGRKLHGVLTEDVSGVLVKILKGNKNETIISI